MRQRNLKLFAEVQYAQVRLKKNVTLKLRGPVQNVCVCARALACVHACVCAVFFYSIFHRPFKDLFCAVVMTVISVFSNVSGVTAARGTVKLHSFDSLAQDYITRLNRSSHFLGQ